MVCKSQGKSAADAKKWNQAIEDAKDTISKCQRKIESMKVAITIFEESRDEGSPYPGSEQQHGV
jgi:hypothetical protein